MGIRVRADKDGFVDISYDKERSLLVFDTNHLIAEKGYSKEEEPLCLKAVEHLSLDIFVDTAVIEVYANERQAIRRRVYPETPSKAIGVSLIGNTENLRSLDVFDMAPAYPY